MKAIVISEKNFDRFFDDTMTKLELGALSEREKLRDILEKDAIKEIVRKFRYELYSLKNRMIQEPF